MQKQGVVFNIQHFSLQDGPGIRTVVFLQGCPLDCIWCHNPESKSFDPQLFFSNEKCVLCGSCVAACKEKCHIIKDGKHTINRADCIACGECDKVCSFDALRLSGKKYTVDQIMAELKKDDVFFGDDGGVTFSGGEPFAQPDFLLELLKKCKEKGYHTCVETSGYTSTKNIIEAAQYIDLFLYDCKETDSEKHKKFTGVDNDLILKNLEALQKLGAKVVLRCPIIPNCNDTEEHLMGIGRLANRFDCVTGVDLLPYHPLGLSKSKQLDIIPQYDQAEFLSKQKIMEFGEILKKNTVRPVAISSS